MELEDYLKSITHEQFKDMIVLLALAKKHGFNVIALDYKNKLKVIKPEKSSGR